jgi:dihydrofolate reductase
MLSLIVAASENNAIGKNNQLLWNLPADTKFFKNTTWALPVIMGRKTYESLGKPLMGRYNIVITSNKNWKPNGEMKVVSNVSEAIEAAGVMQTNEIMVIGGAQIYTETLPIADRVYLTRVHATLDGDAYFPELNTNEWKLTSANHFYKDEKHAFDYSFEIWDRA